jgi:hypothetical protein
MSKHENNESPNRIREPSFEYPKVFFGYIWILLEMVWSVVECAHRLEPEKCQRSLIIFVSYLDHIVKGGRGRCAQILTPKNYLY